MSRITIISCDLCSVRLTEDNAHLWDFYQVDGQPEVCNQCFLLADMAEEYTRADILKNQPIRTTAKAVLALYQVNDDV